MTELEFHKLLHRRISQVSIGASAIRKQGSGGLIKILRDYFLDEIDLEEFKMVLKNEKKYKLFLDKHTLIILEKFPENAKSWGAARKGINLFLREIVYNRFFSNIFSLSNDFIEFNEMIKFMEVPLDKEVAFGLIHDSKGKLPIWKTIKGLTPEISELFQKEALAISKSENIARVNLDLKYWRSPKQ